MVFIWFVRLLMSSYIYFTCKTSTDFLKDHYLGVNSSAALVAYFLTLLYIYLSFGASHTMGKNGYWKSALVFIIIGQVLSTALYIKIGGEGVTYGIERGKLPNKKATGFPFIVPHPQYVGSILTCIGFILLWGFDKKKQPIGPVISYFLIVIFLFVLNGWVESFPPCLGECECK
jgi:cobalamin synthase